MVTATYISSLEGTIILQEDGNLIFKILSFCCTVFNNGAHHVSPLY